MIKDQTDRLGPSETKNPEEKAVSLVGRPLCKTFVEHYTAKQWQTDPKNLPAGNTTHLPARYTFNNRYFNDTYEDLPADGYTAWLENMVTSDEIDVVVDADWSEVRDELHATSPNAPVIYTGPLDRYFGYAEGKLGWRILDFEMEVLNTGDFQGTPVMNYDDVDMPYTRICEFRHLRPEHDYVRDKTVIVKEYFRFADDGDRVYYPTNTPEGHGMLETHRKPTVAEAQENKILFSGRLDTYQYLDMRMAIDPALSMFDNKIVSFFNGGGVTKQEHGH